MDPVLYAGNASLEVSLDSFEEVLLRPTAFRIFKCLNRATVYD